MAQRLSVEQLSRHGYREMATMTSEAIEQIGLAEKVALRESMYNSSNNERQRFNSLERRSSLGEVCSGRHSTCDYA